MSLIYHQNPDYHSKMRQKNLHGVNPATQGGKHRKQLKRPILPHLHKKIAARDTQLRKYESLT